MGFLQGRIEYRDYLIQKIQTIFSKYGLIEAMLIGSKGQGQEDELSDIDIWLTFMEEEMKNIIKNRFRYFEEINEVLLIHENPQNAPKGGVHSLVLFASQNGPQQVDFYFSPESTTEILNKSSFSENKDLIPHEVLCLDAEFAKNPEERVNFLIAMCFIAIKYIKRKDWEIGFLDFVLKEYKDAKELYFQDLEDIKFLENEPAESRLDKLLNSVEKACSGNQLKALREIKKFSEIVLRNA